MSTEPLSTSDTPYGDAERPFCPTCRQRAHVATAGADLWFCHDCEVQFRDGDVHYDACRWCGRTGQLHPVKGWCHMDGMVMCDNGQRFTPANVEVA